jgi:hypothetical protein
MRRTHPLASCALLVLATSGCSLTKTLAKGQIETTRSLGGALDTVGDFEVAKAAALSGVAQFEGVHRLVPTDENTLFMLTKAWGGGTYAYIEDDIELAVEKGDDGARSVAIDRACNAYDRGKGYAFELLSVKDSNWAENVKTEAALARTLEANFKSNRDTEHVFWAAYAMLNRQSLCAPAESLAAASRQMMQHVFKYQPSYKDYASRLTEAALISRTELDAGCALTQTCGESAKTARGIFNEVKAWTGGRSLVVQLNLATRYACRIGDKNLFEEQLHEVLCRDLDGYPREFNDDMEREAEGCPAMTPVPHAANAPPSEYRLTNAIAQRRARRYLASKRLQEMQLGCSFGDAPVPADPAAVRDPAPGPAPTSQLPTNPGAWVPPRHRVTWSSLSVLRYNPLGLQEIFDLGYEYKLFDSDSLLLKDSFVGVSFSPIMTPAFANPGVTLKLQPIALLRLEARASVIQYFGNFNLMQSFPSAETATFSDSQIKDQGTRTDSKPSSAYATTGHNFGLAGELRWAGFRDEADRPQVEARSRLNATYHRMNLEAGDTVWYDQYFDLLVPKQGWTISNDLDIFARFNLQGTSVLRAGVRYNYARSFIDDNTRSDVDAATQRVGPMVAYTFYDEPGKRVNKPTIIGVFNWHLAHPYRTGQDVTQALPYFAVAYAVTGDLLQ